VALRILVSAGEASGDRYAARLVERLRARFSHADFFGCAGPAMRAAGVRPAAQAEELSVVGLVEVLSHLPRIHGVYRRLLAAARQLRPAAAILTDSSGFHLRLAPRLRALGVPVFYLVAPQAWAWREGRVRNLRRNVKELFCIFPFEEDWFRKRGVTATYIGHPLAEEARPGRSREEFFARHRLPPGRPLVTLCPGSRPGEVFRHLPVLEGAMALLAQTAACSFALALPAGAGWVASPEVSSFVRRTGAFLVEGETWDALAHADAALPASGTVALEAALLGVPMAVYYRVQPLTYWLGRPFVHTPFFSMVNLIAGAPVVEELIQARCTPAELARAAAALLQDEDLKARMRAQLAAVAAALRTGRDPLDLAAGRVAASLEEIGVK
jgi:lipid-A-disaccharide synthase